jgi:predicted transport protein
MADSAAIVSLRQPQIEFVDNFLQVHQLQRMLIYFSKQNPTDVNASYGFTDIVVRLINDPLCIIFGQHGVYLFSNFMLLYPYNELDKKQVAYITNFLHSHLTNMAPIDAAPDEENTIVVPSMKIDARVTKQMGGGYTVRPVQLTNIRVSTLNVLTALVRGIMCGTQKHDIKYRQHAVNLQLQRILTRVVVSRAQLQLVNVEIEECVNKKDKCIDVSDISHNGSPGTKI